MIKDISKIDKIKEKLSFLSDDLFNLWLISINKLSNKTPLELIESNSWEDNQILDAMVYCLVNGIE